jgi:hypothetical protein
VAAVTRRTPTDFERSSNAIKRQVLLTRIQHGGVGTGLYRLTVGIASGEVVKEWWEACRAIDVAGLLGPSVMTVPAKIRSYEMGMVAESSSVDVGAGQLGVGEALEVTVLCRACQPTWINHATARSSTVGACCVAIHEHAVLTTELANTRILDHHEATRSTELALAVAIVAVAGKTLGVRLEQVFAYLAEAEHAEAYDGSPRGLPAVRGCGCAFVGENPQTTIGVAHGSFRDIGSVAML